MVEDEFADLYAGLARMGIASRAADEMELFEIAAAFGLHRPEVSTPPEPEWDPVKARVEAAKAGRPAPTGPPRGVRVTAPTVPPK